MQEVAAVRSALYFRFENSRAAYDAFERRVTHFFADKPSGKLLRHNVFAGDGWTKLCAFLDKPVPADPYPCLNRRTRPAATS